ncbi:MAG: hypothetical protein WC301_03270 [Candidatus Omnitrophota bacterium]|jgi:hypothetical protein
MRREGLCVTCVNTASCVFSKEPVVWQCEEFSSFNHAPKGISRVKVKRDFSREAAVESE